MHYEYNIYPKYNREKFDETIKIIKANICNIKEMKYIEDTLDGNQLQTIVVQDGIVTVKNDFMVGAVWVESEIELNFL